MAASIPKRPTRNASKALPLQLSLDNYDITSHGRSLEAGRNIEKVSPSNISSDWTLTAASKSRFSHSPPGIDGHFFDFSKIRSNPRRFGVVSPITATPLASDENHGSPNTFPVLVLKLQKRTGHKHKQMDIDAENPGSAKVRKSEGGLRDAEREMHSIARPRTSIAAENMPPTLKSNPMANLQAVNEKPSEEGKPLPPLHITMQSRFVEGKPTPTPPASGSEEETKPNTAPHERGKGRKQLKLAKISRFRKWWTSSRRCFAGSQPKRPRSSWGYFDLSPISISSPHSVPTTPIPDSFAQSTPAIVRGREAPFPPPTIPLPPPPNSSSPAAGRRIRTAQLHSALRVKGSRLGVILPAGSDTRGLYMYLYAPRRGLTVNPEIVRRRSTLRGIQEETKSYFSPT